MHYHFRSDDIANDIKLFLANGITIVGNMAVFPVQRHIKIREKTAAGELPQINYFTAGSYLNARDPPDTCGTVFTRGHQGDSYHALPVSLPLDCGPLRTKAPASHDRGIIYNR